jgi:hypothetical protein
MKVNDVRIRERRRRQRLRVGLATANVLCGGLAAVVLSAPAVAATSASIVGDVVTAVQVAPTGE